MAKLRKLEPLNRHLLIVPHFQEKKTKSGVLLPEDYDPSPPRHIEATVIDLAQDCSPAIRKIKYSQSDVAKVIIDSKMLEEIIVDNKTYYIILENYVIGFFKGPGQS